MVIDLLVTLKLKYYLYSAYFIPSETNKKPRYSKERAPRYSR